MMININKLSEKHKALIFSRMFRERMNHFRAYIFQSVSLEEREKELAPRMTVLEGRPLFCVFISICDIRTRAHVCHGTGFSLKEAFDNAQRAAEAECAKVMPRWIKADIVKNTEQVSLDEAQKRIFASFPQWFRHGIAFDIAYTNALLETELNACGLIDYHDRSIYMDIVDQYLRDGGQAGFMDVPEGFVIFDTLQYFCDEKNEMMSLYSEGLDTGRRVIEDVNREEIRKVIHGGAEFLLRQMHEDGSFDYGYYPVEHKLIPSYNNLRHTSSLWSMVCAAAVLHDHTLYNAANDGIRYMLNQVKVFPDGSAYLTETNEELKLGGNAVAVILLTQYMKLYNSRAHVEICKALGHGILQMLDMETGTFVHVFNAERRLKNKYRIIYYEGEASFALARLYSLTGDKCWLWAARRVIDHFIEANYQKYRDHWVAYAVNELTMYCPEEKYFTFGLQNIQENLDRIYQQETSYHTYLEMLMAGFEMYIRIKKQGHTVKYLEQFDEQAFVKTILYRTRHMLNGFGFPEYIMYYKKPAYFRGSFFVRHDSFRTRIDDVQHFCGAYISVYNHYEELMALKKEAEDSSLQ